MRVDALMKPEWQIAPMVGLHIAQFSDRSGQPWRVV